MAASKKKKIIIATAVILLLGTVVGFSVFARRGEQTEVQTGKVERRTLLESKVTANGEVRPIQFINLTAEVSGRVTDIFVKEGDQVVKGKPLLRVDPTQLASTTSMQEAALRASQADAQNQAAAITVAENAVNNARAALNSAQADVASAQADLERSRVELNNAQIELKRNTELVESGVVSRSVYDTAKMRFDSASASFKAVEARGQQSQARLQQAQVQVRDAEVRVNQAKTSLEASKARVAQSEASLRQQSDLLSKTTQHSPINGVIASLPIQVGTFAVANLQSTPLMIIADMSVINVEVRVDETDVANVKVGQKVRVKVDALGEKELQGEVAEIAASAVTRSGQTIAQTAVAGTQEAKDFKVVIRLVNLTDEARDRLRPGMSATATITTDTRDNVIAIPLQALVEREEDQLKAGGPSPTPSPSPAPSPGKAAKDKKAIKGVFTVNQSNKAVFVPVETGITGENDIEITKGLQEGQEIIIGPYRQLRNLKNDTAIKREDKSNQAGAANNASK
jgi:HlyD family secretion protein